MRLKVSVYFISNIKILIMKKRNNKTYEAEEYDASQMSLAYGSPQGHMNGRASKEIVATYEGDELMAHKMYKDQVKNAKKEGLDHLYKQDYQPAKFAKAVQFRNSRSYMQKLPSGHYKELDTYQNTQELKQFGLGPYFYIQFFRRTMWLFFVMSLIQGITIYINYKGSGMDAYSASIGSYLIKSTLGNFNGNGKLSDYDNWILAIAPAVNFLAMLLFYFIWKAHYFNTISDQEEDNSDVKPQKFCVEIAGLEEGYVNQEELKSFFSAFGPVYEVSLVRRYKNKLSYFQELDQLQEEIREEQLQIVLGGGDKQDLNALKKQKEKLTKYINTLQIYPKTISAFIHFQYEKSKVDCLTYFNEHYLFDICSHNCMRSMCCCCVAEPEQKYLFHGEKLVIKSEKLPTPEDIEWENYELSACSKFFRVFFAFVIILVFLAVSCTIIGLCSIYIGTHSSNCEGVTIPSTAAAAQSSNNSTIISCYCEANLIASFSDESINTVCSTYSKQILIAQGIQYAVILTSAITNFIFGFIVDKLINCVRPASKSSGLLYKVTIYTTFLIFNSVFIPVLIYADIFGFTPSSYVSFLTLISSDVKNFFAFSSLTFYPEFNTVWYKNVSSVFVNFLVVDTVLTWVFLILDKCKAGYSGLQDDQGKILQKHMNQRITAYKLNVYKEVSYMYLVIFMVAIFMAGVPVLVPLGFVSIFSRYTVNRILLQGSSSKIEGLGQEFMSLSTTILPLMLIFLPLVGEWMLIGNSYIYPDKLPMTIKILSGKSEMLDKELYLPFYIIIGIIAFVEFFFYNTIVRFFSWLSSLCYEKKQTVRAQHTRPFSEYAKGMNILVSFNIRNNDHMRNAILNLEKYLVDKQMD